MESRGRGGEDGRHDCIREEERGRRERQGRKRKKVGRGGRDRVSFRCSLVRQLLLPPSLPPFSSRVEESENTHLRKSRERYPTERG